MAVVMAGIGPASLMIDSVAKSKNKDQSDLNLALMDPKSNQDRNLESLEVLAGSVAHDLNNLLVGVMSNAEVINMRCGNDEFIGQRTEEIVDSAKKASELGSQMLSYAGKQNVKKVSFDVNQLVNQVVEKFKTVHGGNIRVVLSDAPLVIQADLGQLSIVLEHLIDNAYKASTEDSQIFVRTGIETVDDIDSDFNLICSGFEPGDRAFIEVEDFGTGIEHQHLPRIFDIFFSTEEDRQGMGLAIVYGIVKRHDGLIRLTLAVDVVLLN